jgi:hypothetical protein
MPNPWVSLRRDQLIPVGKAVNEKEQLEKGLDEEEEGEKVIFGHCGRQVFVITFLSCVSVFLINGEQQHCGDALQQKTLTGFVTNYN